MINIRILMIIIIMIVQITRQPNLQTNGYNHTTTSISLPSYPILNPPKNSYINERHSTTLKLKRQSKNVENITYIMGYYPRNG